MLESIRWAVVAEYAAIIAAIWVAYMYGCRMARRRLRAAVLRHNPNAPVSEVKLAIVPADDGAMEILMSRSAVKMLRRGQSIETLLAGERQQAVFRVRCL